MDQSPAAAQIPHGIMGLQPQTWTWASTFLTMLGVCALLWLVWIYWQKRRAVLPEPSVGFGANKLQPAMDPWDRLRRAMEALQVSTDWNQQNCEEYFFQLSFILREALELKTAQPITGQTLAETRQTLGKIPSLSANFQQDLIKFLSLAEQLKFAGQWIAPVEALEWQKKVQGWLEQLRNDF